MQGTARVAVSHEVLEQVVGSFLFVDEHQHAAFVGTEKLTEQFEQLQVLLLLRQNHLRGKSSVVRYG